MSDKIPIFYTGATGYIGAAVLQRILKHPKVETFAITTLVRSTEKAQLLERDFGVKAVVGSLGDHGLLTKLAENAHVVMHFADIDNEAAMKAILAGLKQRHEKLGDTPILIHTSGAACLLDNSAGEYKSESVTSDLDTAALDALPPTAIHRVVDQLVFSADAEGYVRTYMVSPSLVYGIGSGPLYDAGIANKHTIQPPLFANVFLKRGRAGVVGKGASVASDVHIDDTADLYYRLFDAASNDRQGLSHGREGYFFAENGEHSMYDLCKAFGEALVALGRAEDAEPTVFTPEERVEYFGMDFIAFLHFGNVRCRADRARKELGWTPTHPTEDLFASVRPEVEAVLKKQQAGAQ